MASAVIDAQMHTHTSSHHAHQVGLHVRVDLHCNGGLACWDMLPVQWRCSSRMRNAIFVDDGVCPKRLQQSKLAKRGMNLLKKSVLFIVVIQVCENECI